MPASSRMPPAPEELAGRTVGVAGYQLTANVWIRGIDVYPVRSELGMISRRPGPAELFAPETRRSVVS